LEVETLCFSNPDNHAFYKRHDIRSVPRLVIENGDEVTIVSGTDDIVAEVEKYHNIENAQNQEKIEGL
jgi:hypothetical protein